MTEMGHHNPPIFISTENYMSKIIIDDTGKTKKHELLTYVFIEYVIKSNMTGFSNFG